jgi:hypothetical protein
LGSGTKTLWRGFLSIVLLQRYFIAPKQQQQNMTGDFSGITSTVFQQEKSLAS